MNMTYTYWKLPKWLQRMWPVNALFRKILMRWMVTAARYIQGRSVQMQCPTLACPPFTPEMLSRYTREIPIGYYAGMPVINPDDLPAVIPTLFAND